MEFFTVGVYHSTENTFFAKLISNDIDTFCDIRQRRGVRGAEYAFVNSNRLQSRLELLGIKYVYASNLAPTNEIRDLQKEADLQAGEAKRTRQKLGDVFVREYQAKILSKFDPNYFIEQLEQIGAKKIVLFCVEEHAEACHRSIVADRLASLNYKVTHL